MSKRLLAIGVGGSGKAALTIMKERLEETYGQVPDNVVLLSIDTDDLRDVDVFAGTQLNGKFDERGREPEFQHIISKPGVTMNTIFADITSGRAGAYMQWLEHQKLAQKLAPSDNNIQGGAQQRRPIGRVAVFQRWDNPVYSSIVSAIARVYGEPDESNEPLDAGKIEQSKRQVFIIGSVAGGTGSGSLIDVANLVRHAIQSNITKWASLDVSAIIVLPDAFSTYTTKMNDPSNLKPNSYAALRELDRFIRTHSIYLPYMIRYGDDIRSITWVTQQLLDHAYLVDTASPSSIGDTDLSGDPMRGVFPVIADFVMAHVDESLGAALATNRSNANTIHYDKGEGWQYSSFNVLTYIFPVDDVIESFSYRSLRELFTRQYLPIQDKKTSALIEQDAAKEADRLFSDNSVAGKVNPGVIQKAIAATRKVNPETPDVSWTGLFGMISLSDSVFEQDYKDLDQWLNFLSSNLIPSRQGDYKREGFDEGYTRLLNFSEQYMDDCLGPQTDPDDEESRFGGEFDKILGRYRDALRQRFSEALDAAALDVLNRRDPNTKMLAPARLPFARAMTATLKTRLVNFKSLLEGEYRRLDIEARIRQSGEELRNNIAWLQQTKDTRPPLIGKPEALKAQEAYISLFRDKMDLSLHQRIFRTILDVLDALGASEKDRDSNVSVVDQLGLELENWQATFQEVDKILAGWSRTHEKNREEKRQIKRAVRQYLTTPEFEDQLYQQPEHAYRIFERILGQVKGETGIIWKRVEDTVPLNYRMVSVWNEEARGAEKIAQEFFKGAKELFQVVREHVTIADRMVASFRAPSGLVNVASQIKEPFLRYSSATNGKTMGPERYISFNQAEATEEASKFLEQARSTLRDQGFTVDTSAESLTACTVVEVARGVKLNAVDQFIACETDYRNKLYRGIESLHLFPEEQVATIYESRIETLSEPDNRQRPLSPELVVAMGDEDKLKAFTLACAYGLIHDGPFLDKESRESTEIWLTLKKEDTMRELVLSHSESVQKLDNTFRNVGAEEKIARLYLNALQNFVLLATQKPGVPSQMIATLVDELGRRSVHPHIDNPFTLSLRESLEAIRYVFEPLSATQRIDQYLQPFLSNMVTGKGQDGKPKYGFKKSPAPKVRDMGTVMHLILQDEINRLKETVKK